MELDPRKEEVKSSSQPKSKQVRHIFSGDYDGCTCSLEEEEGALSPSVASTPAEQKSSLAASPKSPRLDVSDYIQEYQHAEYQEKRGLLYYIREQVGDFKHLLIGSNRQSMLRDQYNMLRAAKGDIAKSSSCLITMASLAKKWALRPERFLMEDVVKQQAPGTAYAQAIAWQPPTAAAPTIVATPTAAAPALTYPSPLAYAALLDPATQPAELKHARQSIYQAELLLGGLDTFIVYDETKIALVYAQMQQMASKYPAEALVYHFIDDRRDILDGLVEFFRQNPALIPQNIRLNLLHYAPHPQRRDHTKSVTKLLTIQGSGTANPNYAQTLCALNKRFLKLTDDNQLLRGNDFFKKKALLFSDKELRLRQQLGLAVVPGDAEEVLKGCFEQLTANHSGLSMLAQHNLDAGLPPPANAESLLESAFAQQKAQNLYYVKILYAHRRISEADYYAFRQATEQLIYEADSDKLQNYNNAFHAIELELNFVKQVTQALDCAKQLSQANKIDESIYKEFAAASDELMYSPAELDKLYHYLEAYRKVDEQLAQRREFSKARTFGTGVLVVVTIAVIVAYISLVLLALQLINTPVLAFLPDVDTAYGKLVTAGFFLLSMAGIMMGGSIYRQKGAQSAFFYQPLQLQGDQATLKSLIARVADHKVPAVKPPTVATDAEAGLVDDGLDLAT